MSQSQYYFSGGPYLQALQGLLTALMRPGGVVRLTGRPGVGKTALCVKLAQFLRRKDRHVLLFDNAVESPDLLRTMLARELDLPDSANFVSLLEDAFANADRAPLVLLFDDAHLLSEVTLLEIFRLADVRANDKNQVTVLLCGEPDLGQRLHDKHGLQDAESRVTANYDLEPMTAAALEDFFTGLAERMGLAQTGLTSDALHQLYRNCKGYPGPALNMSRQILLDRSDQQAQSLVTRDDVNRFIRAAASNEVLPSQQFAEAIVQRRGLLPVAAVVVVASIAFLYQQLSGETAPQATAPEAAQNSPFAADTHDDVMPEPMPAATVPEPEPDAAPDLAEADEPASADVTAQQQLTAAIDATAEPPLDASAQELALVMEMARQAALQQVSRQDAVSDSGLALVTAAERGISADQFALPDYEDLLAVDDVSTEEVAGAESLLPASEAVADASNAQAQPDTTVRQPDSEEPGRELPAGANRESEQTEENVAVAVSGAGASADTAEPAPGPALDPAPVHEPGLTTPRAAVERWVAAWQSRSLDDYFQAYHSEFEPRYHDSVAAWHRNRERVIGNASGIRLELSDFEIISVSDQRVEVQFWLSYESASYRDETLKKLVLAREGEHWLILEEVNLEVRVRG